MGGERPEGEEAEAPDGARPVRFDQVQGAEPRSPRWSGVGMPASTAWTAWHPGGGAAPTGDRGPEPAPIAKLEPASESEPVPEPEPPGDAGSDADEPQEMTESATPDFKPALRALQKRAAELEATLEAERAAHAEALAAAEAELRAPMVAAAQRLDRTATEISRWFALESVKLARTLAERVLRQRVDGDFDFLDATVRDALRLAGTLERVRLRVHPDDAEHLFERAPELAKEITGRTVDVLVERARDVDRGGCIVLFDQGLVDARIQQQLQNVADAVEEAVRAHLAPQPKAVEPSVAPESDPTPEPDPEVHS